MSFFRTRPQPVQLAETITRYIREKGHYRVATFSKPAEAKAKAFEPYRKSNPPSVSTFRTNFMSSSNVSDVLKYFRDEEKPALASVDLLVETVASFGLQVVPEESLFRWHANIEGWANKAEEKQQMLSLADASNNFKFV